MNQYTVTVSSFATVNIEKMYFLISFLNFKREWKKQSCSVTNHIVFYAINF